MKTRCGWPIACRAGEPGACAFTWAGEDYWRTMAVHANGHAILPPQQRPANPAFVEVPIPRAHRARPAFAGVCRRPARAAAGGQQVAETWLVPISDQLRCDGHWQGP
jgi:hypothetical protein